MEWKNDAGSNGLRLLDGDAIEEL
ncbi:uncharacterized protein G2W53_032664 [Senna tora]|uniref:Uncharacterized protein n=1 Tax=Senna tora TaxID=362788 RepID=A0A834SWB6_9FABA|nr:uncharacterized protein G2W53_032664 [Senna tora]